ncbi:MAG TPA: SseB family protein [Candidatus Dormibacteraeota bacterium]|nr:SseB family protein [Candidatus Dormibacteraeota bacterium]
MSTPKRSEVPEDAQNDLELALLEAATEPAARSRFYKSLMTSDLYLVGRLETVEGKGKEGTVTADPGDKLVLWPRGDDPRIHVFTSLARLQSAIGDAKVPYVGLPTDVLFAVVDPELDIVLNEGVWYGKQIVPEERRLLMEGPGSGDPG